MKLFIWEANWSYCGGAVIVLAHSKEEAQTLANQNVGSTKYKFKDEPGDYDSYTLTFIGEFEGTNLGEPRVVLDSWNYA